VTTKHDDEKKTSSDNEILLWKEHHELSA